VVKKNTPSAEKEGKIFKNKSPLISHKVDLLLQTYIAGRWAHNPKAST
jgi:hypothetical protein